MRKVALAVVLSSVMVVGLCATPGGSALAGPVSTHPVAIPAGWRIYDRAKISVPPDWTVMTPNGCPVRAAQGILAQGAPTRLTNCPVGVASVVVAELSPHDRWARARCKSIKVIGRNAYVLPCKAAGSEGIVQYLLPSLGIQAVGSGIAGQNVGGPGESTVVGRVLHTLR